jgi:thymidylate kinase
MTRSTELLINVFDYLNREVNYAVLRNYDGLPHNNKSRDIDIVIERKELLNHRHHIVAIIVNSGWNIVSYFNESRMITIVCGFVNDLDTEMIQFDFFINNSAYGVLLTVPEQYIRSRVFNGYIYHVSREYEFLDKYIYNRAVGAEYPKKYLSLKEEMLSNVIVKEELQSIFGNNNLTYIDKKSKQYLLYKAFIKNLKKRPLDSLNAIISYYKRLCKNILNPISVPTIGFTGPDGSGKTTVINKIIEHFHPIWSKDLVLMHSRPLLIPNIGEAAHSVGLKKEVDRDYSNPHRGGKTSLLSSFIRLCYYTLDYTFGYVIKIWPNRFRRKLIIFDRYYTDFISDSRRSNIHLNMKFLYIWGKLFIPKLNYNILLTADAEVILGRKQELDPKGIEVINSKLNYLSTKKGFYLIKNNGSAEDAVQKIIRNIFDEQQQKNLKLLKYGKRKN